MAKKMTPAQRYAATARRQAQERARAANRKVKYSPVDKAAQAMQEASGHVKSPTAKGGVTGVPQKRADLEALPDDRLMELWQRSGTVLSKAQRTRVVRELGRRRLDPETDLRRGAPSPPIDSRPLVDQLADQMPSKATAKRFRANVKQMNDQSPEALRAYAQREMAIGRRGTTQSSKSPSSTATSSQDQCKVAERRADASGPTIRPTAASSQASRLLIRASRITRRRSQPTRLVGLLLSRSSLGSTSVLKS